MANMGLVLDGIRVRLHGMQALQKQDQEELLQRASTVIEAAKALQARGEPGAGQLEPLLHDVHQQLQALDQFLTDMAAKKADKIYMFLFADHTEQELGQVMSGLERAVQALATATQASSTPPQAAQQPQAPQAQPAAGSSSQQTTSLSRIESGAESRSFTHLKGNLTCPISQEVMRDPVMTSAGITYERTEIERWLSVHNTDPVTRRVLSTKELIPNYALRGLIASLPQSKRRAPGFDPGSSSAQGPVAAAAIGSPPEQRFVASQISSVAPTSEGDLPSDQDPLAGHPKYKGIRYLSQDASGFVMLYTNKATQEQVAVKFIPRRQSGAHVKQEVLNLYRLSHPLIAEFKEVIVTDSFLGIVMEHAAGDNLHALAAQGKSTTGSVTGRLGTDMARCFFQQAIIALDYCHRMGVVNTDVRLENMIREPMEGDLPAVKIINITSARDVNMLSPGPLSAYLAPEEVQAGPGGALDGRAAGIWSCGMLLYLMLVGNYPWMATVPTQPAGGIAADSTKGAIEWLRNPVVRIPNHVSISPECKDLLQRMLHKDPAQRITMEQILAHPWFKEKLPPGVDTMNQKLVAIAPSRIQTEAEVLKILEDAQTPALISAALPHSWTGNDQYAHMQILSQGRFGSVQLCRDKRTNEQVVIKFVTRGGMVDHQFIAQEVLNQRKLDHPHMLEIKEVVVTDECLGIVMEHAPGGTLAKYVQSRVRAGKAGALEEPVAQCLFQQVVLAVDYCHRMGVADRDIRLENIMLQPEEVEDTSLLIAKLVDLGTSKALCMVTPISEVEKVAYICPESLSKAVHDGRAADMWRCGILLYVMLVGQYPWKIKTEAKTQAALSKAILDAIKRFQSTPPKGVSISANCLDLLSRLLLKDPAQRITMEQVLAHPWFKENLPQGAEIMNDEPVEWSADANVTGASQSVEEMAALLQEARAPKRVKR